MDYRFVLEQVIGATAIFVIAAIAAWMLSRQSAAYRYFIWTLASAAVLVVPIVSVFKPVGAPAVVQLTPIQTALTITVGATDAFWRPSSFQILLAVWIVGFVLTLSRLIVGIWRTSASRKRSTPSGISAAVEVRLSDNISVPETFGFWKPVILLPVQAELWPDERLSLVLAHELIHVRRHDWLTQLLAQCSTCVYWFHPLAWFALTQLKKERELACDDGVLQQGYRGSDYAQHLVDIARSIRSHTEILSPSITMATRSQLENRVRAILNPTLKRGTVNNMMKISAAVCTAVAILLFSSAATNAAGPVVVSGTVLDASGAAVPNARIILAPKGMGKAYATTSGPAGGWAIRSVVPGSYVAEVLVPGFAKYQQQVDVSDDRPLQIEVRMAVGTIEQTINVKAQGYGAVRSADATAASTGPASRIRIGGNIQSAKVVKMIPPEYPLHMKQAGITGAVMLQAVIGREGKVLNVESIDEGIAPDLVDAAVAAVKQWEYQPTLLNGQPVEVVTLVNVNFTLAP